MYVYLGEDRAPASVRTAKDYIELPASSIKQAAHNQLISMSEILRKDGMIGIQLGHPLLKQDGGYRNFACPAGARPAFFDRVELTFIGDGVAQSGEPPQLIVESGCQASEKIEKLEPVWLPMHEIMISEARDKDLQLYGDRPVIIQLKQIPGEWPESWHLAKVRFYPEGRPEEALEFVGQQLREARGSLLSFEYKAAEANRAPTNK